MKEFNPLINFLHSKIDINDNIIHDLHERCTSISKSKNEILVDKGQICKNIYFLTEGLVRNYFIDINGREFTRLITYENKFFTNFLSFQKQSPSRETIECLEDTRLILISKKDFNYLVDKHPILFRLFTEEVIKYHNFHLEKLEFLSLLSPKDKLEYLWANEPEIVKRVSNSVLASYIGVKQETCSRVKKLIFKKK